jgi:hypothetical protein
MTLDYRRCRQARAKLVRWQRQLLKLVDALEAARVQEGEAVFRKLCASPSLTAIFPGPLIFNDRA